MYTVRRTDEFDGWLHALRDREAAFRILNRLRNMERGNFGMVAPIGEGISEMKIDYGPGYRVYYTRIGEVVFLLLAGGDKSSQRRDIVKAKRMAKTIRSATK
ncbi:type II toxin-antitoxin system RelE/ParE family toxin [Phyllobacterium bourgognense]|uniref:Putative addiction module killer protein n=1 Tax=Phyllobacterium bourgognense TaxID=314236 RepID=A0A368Z214_9HYPH|nr:type II toxin-antitoxin system RelE/ParE family toxin [Phyllobacterium bourgognense]RCW86492.1 putative addiction module killer protein [Phyllobacterium bourgognense]